MLRNAEAASGGNGIDPAKTKFCSTAVTSTSALCSCLTFISFSFQARTVLDYMQKSYRNAVPNATLGSDSARHTLYLGKPRVGDLADWRKTCNSLLSIVDNSRGTTCVNHGVTCEMYHILTCFSLSFLSFGEVSGFGESY